MPPTLISKNMLTHNIQMSKVNIRCIYIIKLCVSMFFDMSVGGTVRKDGYFGTEREKWRLQPANGTYHKSKGQRGWNMAFQIWLGHLLKRCIKNGQWKRRTCQEAKRMNLDDPSPHARCIWLEKAQECQKWVPNVWDSLRKEEFVTKSNSYFELDLG